MIKIKSVGRSCDGCTKCCEGWLFGTAYGYDFNPYKKCAFLNQGCTIYPMRPQDPCKSFECQWKVNRNLPEWLKPDKSDVIILKKYIDIFDYLMIFPTGKKISQKVYDWAEEYSKLDVKNHVVVSEQNTYKLFSKHKHFREIAKEKFKV